MPKVKHIYGIQSMSTVKPSPKTTSRQYHNASQTQPMTHRQIIKTEESECDRKECLINKWSIQHNTQALHSLQKEAEKYKTLYIRERKKLGDTYKQVESIIFVLTKKEAYLKEKEERLNDIQAKSVKLQAENSENAAFLHQQKTQIIEKEKHLIEEIDKYSQLNNNQVTLNTELQQLKGALESSVSYLQSKESEMFLRLQQLANEEQEAIKRIGSLNDFLENTGEHQRALQQIEAMLSVKTQNLEQLQQSVLQKQEELSYFEQQLQLRSMCTSLNEGAFFKRIACQTERISQSNLRTPTQNQSRQGTGPFFKNQQENIMISTIGSRENSPYSKDSFRLFKKNGALQADKGINFQIMSELNI